MRLFLYSFLFFTAFTLACRHQTVTEQERYTAEEFLYREAAVDGIKFRYRVYLPEKVGDGEKLPVMLYLHGAGNRGGDNESQLNGLANIIREKREKFRFIVVIPQCKADRFWDERMIRYAVTALDDTVTEFHSDPNKLYAAGFSLGGYGVWSAAAMFPDKFAALVPMSGRVLPRPAEMKDTAPIVSELARSKNPYEAFAESLRNKAIWVFQGSEDAVVAPDNSRRIVQALKNAGSSAVRYSEIPGAGHQPLAFDDPELFSWLSEQRLSATD